MKNVKITVLKKAEYKDLMELYENHIQHACDVSLGQVFVSVDAIKPQGLCDSAWGVLLPFVRELALGGGNFFDGWMKNEKSAMVSCNDGFRPVSFLVETID